MQAIRMIAAGTASLGGTGYLLVRFAPAPAELARQLPAPHDWIAQVGTDAAAATVAGALLWLCALWVTIGLIAVWLGQLPGLAGQLGRDIARCAVPVAIQRLVAASAGFSLLLGGASAGAVGQPARDPGTAASTMAAPGWPLDQPAPTRPADRPSRPADRPSQPAGRPSQPVGRPSQPAEPSSQQAARPSTSRPPPGRPAESSAANRSVAGGWPLDPSSGTASTDPAPTSAAPDGPTATDPTRPNRPAGSGSHPAPSQASKPQPTVTVRPGDSLWTIAGVELGPTATDQQIAIAWPYWYRANRPLIGRDPNLLRSGTRLNRPAAEADDELPDGQSSHQSQPIREGLRP